MNKPDRATVETLAVRQIQAFRAEAAAFPSQSHERGVRSDAGKRSRWGRIKTAAKAGRRPGLGGLIRFGARVMVAPWRSPGPAKPRQAPAAAPAPDLETTHPAVSDDSAAGRGQSLASAVEAGTRLVVAAIMDPFTRQAFEPEAQIVDLHPDTWHDELEASHPDLLFIESAWRGHNDSWHDTVQTKPPELVGIVQWCQDHGIPTVFWNKEDPVYYHRYIKVAELFDHVFSTDLDSIPRYIRDLGHRRVHVLPFAAQPLLCNPIETQDRQARAVFAGSYYQGFAERNKALFAMIDGTDKVLPLEIYDRNFGSQAHFFQWPKPYSRHVVGTLPPEQIDVAYKGCRLALNVNTVTASQTMLARRAFDLVASGTPTVSNYSRSIPVLFGDLVFASNSTDRIEEGVRRIIDHPEESDKRRAMGLRHIIGQHTYEARFRHVIETTSGAQLPRATTPLGLVAHARTADDVARCRELVQGVGDPRIPLVVVSDDGDVARLCQAEGVCVLSEAAAGTTTLGQVLRGVACVAAIRPEHWYGPHYLTSLLEAMAYSTAQAAAKITRFRDAPDHPDVVDPGNEYRWWAGDPVMWHRALVRFDDCAEQTIASLVLDPAATIPSGLQTVGVDRFDYCESGRAPVSARPDLSADLGIDVGVPIDAIMAIAPDDGAYEASGASFLPDGKEMPAGCVARSTDEGIVMAWSLDEAEPARLPASDRVPVSSMAGAGEILVWLNSQGSTRLDVDISWLDANGVTLPGTPCRGELLRRFPVPPRASTAVLSLVLQGTGTALIRSVTVTALRSHGPMVLDGWSASRLIVADGYPDYDAPTHHESLHERALESRDNADKTVVFVLSGGGSTTYREYQGIDVITGTQDDLVRLLASRRFREVEVDFLGGKGARRVRIEPTSDVGEVIDEILGLRPRAGRAGQASHQGAQDIAVGRMLARETIRASKKAPRAKDQSSKPPLRLLQRPLDAGERDAEAARRSQRLADAIKADRKLVVGVLASELIRTALAEECVIVDLASMDWSDPAVDLVLLIREGPTDPSVDIDALLAWCHEREVPTALWCARDPSGRDDALATAAKVDHVLTADLESVAFYAQQVRHRRVLVCPPAVTPCLDSPQATTDVAELEPSHPSSSTAIEPLILQAAARGVPIAARFSRSTRVLMGDLVPMSDSPDEVRRLGDQARAGGQSTAQRCALARDHVMGHHTYAQRLDFIVHRVAGLRSDLEESSSASAHGIDTGWSLGDIVAEGERIVAAIHDRSPVTEVAPETFPHGSFEASGAGKAVLSRHPEGLLMSFRGPPSQAWHIGFGGSVPVSQVVGTGQVAFLSFDAQIRGQGHVGVRVSWMDDDGQRVPGKTYFETGCTHRIPVPGNAARIRLFLTVKGEGIALLTSIKLAGAPVDPLPILVGRKTRTLLVTDYYPTYDLPYQRGFVHSRVKSYAAYGAPVDVWVTSREPGIAHREYDTVDVMSGRHAELHEVLRSGAYDTVLVHTMYAPLWKVLKEHLDDVRIVAWMHGAELHRYWLDPENPTMDEAREVQIEQIKADPRFAHWREVLADPHPNLRFVVVSQTFLDQMNEDLAVMGVGFPADQTVIIHNPVSPDRFPYRPKPVEQRKRLMSLRPFWTRKYANDLTVAAIVEMSSEPWFGELEILVAGDGKDFDEIVAPLVGFGNVTLENRFFTQPEIAALHREYGVALVPTRADSQGVSRDEAMSSGLVPITTAVDAIPEFVSKDEGYVVPGEDAHAIADAVRDLYHHPEVFARKSAAAAARIRRTVADDVIIPQEIGQFHDSP